MGQRALPHAELDRLVETHRALHQLDALELIGGRALLSRSAERAYRFAHYSIRVFLLARALREWLLDPRRGTLRLDVDGAAWSERVVGALAQGEQLPLTRQMLDFLIGAEAVSDAGAVVRRDGGGVELTGLGFTDPLADGGEGPPMQWLPAGSFPMGSADDDAEADSYERPHTDTAG